MQYENGFFLTTDDKSAALALAFLLPGPMLFVSRRYEQHLQLLSVIWS
jgi:hypothetical protein